MRLLVVYFSLVLLIACLIFGCKKEVEFLDYKRLGTSSSILLSANTFSTLVVQVSYMPGYRLSNNNINSLTNFLEARLNKPGGIQILQQEVVGTNSSMSIAEAANFEKQVRTEFTSGNKVAVHILITDNDFTDKSFLAKAYYNTSFVLFGRTIYNTANFNISEQVRLTNILLQHEFGHLLGLVDNGSSMVTNHLDVGNGAHCTNVKCLMFHEVEINSAFNSSSPVPTLDANCIADLQANGGK
jgi:hypothetical protein